MGNAEGVGDGGILRWILMFYFKVSEATKIRSAHPVQLKLKLSASRLHFPIFMLNLNSRNTQGGSMEP
jgi:hypothetical protein